MSSRSRSSKGKTVFVTGTDTGAGKTLVAGMLLHHLRVDGYRALAMKPFCSGGTGDAELLNALQDNELTRAEINPFYFAEPIAPLVAARSRRQFIPLNLVLDRIRRVKSKCDCLIIEGAGGLLSPLGEGYSALNLIRRLSCPVIVAARDKLGVINHARLTVNALQAVGVKDITIVLMGCISGDNSQSSNHRITEEILRPVRVFRIPFLGAKASKAVAVKNNYKKLKKTIAQFSHFAIFTSVLLNDSRKRLKTKTSVDSPRSKK